MRKKNYFLITAVLFGVFLVIGGGCRSDKAGPKELLDKYFSSAIKQDYAAAYACYYSAYAAKVSREEYIRHRKEASVLQCYEIISLQQDGDTAQAEVLLAFAPSKKLGRKEPAKVKVKEDMIREGGTWKIKVW